MYTRPAYLSWRPTRVVLAFVTLALGALATARFEIPTPEAKKAAAAWERELKRDFDLRELHRFLRRTIAEQRNFEGVDLAGSAVDRKWRVNRSDRLLVSGSWTFLREGDDDGFQLRHHPGAGDREVVLVCRRSGRREFRLVAVRWDAVRLILSQAEAPATAAPVRAHACLRRTPAATVRGSG